MAILIVATAIAALVALVAIAKVNPFLAFLAVAIRVCRLGDSGRSDGGEHPRALGGRSGPGRRSQPHGAGGGLGQPCLFARQRRGLLAVQGILQRQHPRHLPLLDARGSRPPAQDAGSASATAMTCWGWGSAVPRPLVDMACVCVAARLANCPISASAWKWLYLGALSSLRAACRHTTHR